MRLKKFENFELENDNDLMNDLSKSKSDFSKHIISMKIQDMDG